MVENLVKWAFDLVKWPFDSMKWLFNLVFWSFNLVIYTKNQCFPLKNMKTGPALGGTRPARYFVLGSFLDLCGRRALIYNFDRPEYVSTEI